MCHREQICIIRTGIKYDKVSDNNDDEVDNDNDDVNDEDTDDALGC